MVALATTALTLSLFSCDDTSSEMNDTENLSTTELITLEASVEEVEAVVDTYSFYAVSALEFDTSTGKTSKTTLGDGVKDRSGFFASCANFSKETVDDTTTITISFPEDCEDRNGNTVSGTITIVKSISETDKSRIVTFTDFAVNGHVINGTKQHEYTTENASGNPQLSGTVDISVTTDEGTITKVGNRVIEITSGADTDTHFDDEKTITGSHTFTDAEGTSKVVEITTPLVKPAACKFITQGVKTYTEDDATMSLDYGDGTCDNIATFTDNNGISTEIELKKRRRH